MKNSNEQLINMYVGLVILISVYVFAKTSSLPLAFMTVFFLLTAYLIIQAFFRYGNNIRLKKSGIDDIDKMNGIQFEKFLSLLFIELGYKSKITKASGDFGADLIISKDGIKTVVQAKRYSSKVGIKAVQEVVSSMNYYKASKAMVVTNSYFSKAAIELAQSNNVEMVDRDRLVDILLQNKF